MSNNNAKKIYALNAKCRCMVRKIDNQDQIVNDAVAMAIEMELKVVGKKIEVEVL